MVFIHYPLLGTAGRLSGVSRMGLAAAYPTKPFNL
jgi:hypothetical protein